MEYDEVKLAALGIDYEPVFKFDKEVIRDFTKILISINYAKEMPEWSSNKIDFLFLKKVIQVIEIFMRSSLCFPVIINGHHINKKFIIGSWIFKTLKIAYPNPIYQIFPPHFGKNHIKFMESIMQILNSFVCKKDFERLLNFSDNLPEGEEKKMFKDLEHTTMNSLYESYIVEKYTAARIRNVSKE